MRRTIQCFEKLFVSKSTPNNLYKDTPFLKMPSANGVVELYYKMDLLQPSGSFKDRGISEMIKKAKEHEKVTKLVCSSGGNAGHAVAHAGKHFGIPCDIFVPVTTLPMMIELIKAKGATCHVGGKNWNEADGKAREALKSSLTAKYIPPYDDPMIWEGHSTIVDELKKDLNDRVPDAIIVSVGGGGLLAGIQIGLQRNGWSKVKVLAVETEGAASFAAASRAGQVVALDKISTIASSLGALSVTPAVLGTGVSTESVVVTDQQAVQGCLQFQRDFEEHGFLVEPACGAALAVVRDLRNSDGDISNNKLVEQHLKGARLVVVVVCGGSAVNQEMLDKWQRDLQM